MRPLLGKAGQVRAGGAVPWAGGSRLRRPLVLGISPLSRCSEVMAHRPSLSQEGEVKETPGGNHCIE